MMPFSKTGGLADVAGTLPEELLRLGHKVIAFLPRYRNVEPKHWELETVVKKIEIPLGSDKETCRILHTRLKSGLDVYLVDHQEFFCREGIYGTTAGDYPDNDRRFIFFQRAVLEALQELNFTPDVMHCHDWQTGLIPVYLKSIYSVEPNFRKTRSVFTIHNLGYQGNFPPDSLPLTGLEWEHFRLERLEFYGKVSFLKGGIVDADMVTTVSERYSQEIQTKEFGCGMEGVLQRRKDTLHGVVNGIDTKEWDPEHDPDIAARYNFETIQKKEINKHALQKENGLPVDSAVPVVGMVSRLVDQKGMDILVEAMDALVKMGVQFVLLGTGEEKYHHALRDVAKKNRNHVRVHILFDSKMAKRIYAGSDLFLLPSYYEPCGLGQMIALRYGTVPVVRATGGLADTVQNFNVKSGQGNGFSFEAYKAEALTDAVRRAVETFRDAELWRRITGNAMASDFSWAASARKYIKLFEMTKRRAVTGLER